MRQLVAKHRNRRRKPAGHASGECSPYRHAVGEIVQTVAHDDHPRHRREVLRGCVDVTVQMRVAVVGGTVFGQYDSVVGLRLFVSRNLNVRQHFVDFCAIVGRVEVVGAFGHVLVRFAVFFLFGYSSLQFRHLPFAVRSILKSIDKSKTAFFTTHCLINCISFKN